MEKTGASNLGQAKLLQRSIYTVSCLATLEEIRQKQDNEGGNVESDRRNIRPNHRYRNSVVSSIMFSAGCRIYVIEEAKKAMPAEKLAELTASDPKYAGREAHKKVFPSFMPKRKRTVK